MNRGLGISLPTGDPVKGDAHLLLIGIDDYVYWQSLRGPVADVEAVERVLHERYTFAPERTVKLLNGEATRRGIIGALEDMQDRLGPDDSLLVYYAGHGFTDRQRVGYWIPHEAVTDPQEATGWLPNASVRGALAEIACAHVLLLSDSCFAGDLLDEHRGEPPDYSSDYYRRAHAFRSRQVMTSGGSEPVSDAGLGGHSPFAYHLVDTLRRNSDPCIDPIRLYDHVRGGVTGQQPLLGALTGAGHQRGGSFLLFLRPEPEAVVEASPLVDAAAILPGEGDAASQEAANLRQLAADPSVVDTVVREFGSQQTDEMWEELHYRLDMARLLPVNEERLRNFVERRSARVQTPPAHWESKEAVQGAADEIAGDAPAKSSVLNEPHSAEQSTSQDPQSSSIDPELDEIKQGPPSEDEVGRAVVLSSLDKMGRSAQAALLILLAWLTILGSLTYITAALSQLFLNLVVVMLLALRTRVPLKHIGVVAILLNAANLAFVPTVPLSDGVLIFTAASVAVIGLGFGLAYAGRRWLPGFTPRNPGISRVLCFPVFAAFFVVAHLSAVGLSFYFDVYSQQVEFDRDGIHAFCLAWRGGSQSVRQVDLFTGRTLQRRTVAVALGMSDGSYRSIESSPQGRIRLSGVGPIPVDTDMYGSIESNPKTVSIGRPDRLLIEGQQGVQSLSVGEDGNKALAIVAGEWVLWDTLSGRELNRVADPSRPEVAALGDDGQLVLTGNRRGVIKLWDAVSGKLVREYRVAPSDYYLNLGFTATGHIAYATNRLIQIWTSDTGEELRTISECPRWTALWVSLSLMFALIITQGYRFLPAALLDKEVLDVHEDERPQQ